MSDTSRPTLKPFPSSWTDLRLSSLAAYAMIASTPSSVIRQLAASISEISRPLPSDTSIEARRFSSPSMMRTNPGVPSLLQSMPRVVCWVPIRQRISSAASQWWCRIIIDDSKTHRLESLESSGPNNRSMTSRMIRFVQIVLVRLSAL